MNQTVNVIPRGLLLHSPERSACVVPAARAAAYLLFFVLLFIIVPSLARSINPSLNRLDAALTTYTTVSRTAPLVWSKAVSEKPPKFYFPNPMRPYMVRLKNSFHIQEMTAAAKSDLERAKLICDWVHHQWKHKGFCPVQKNDPIAILEAAKNGSEFSCYEYSLVAAGCLNCIGIKSRTVVLLPRNVERNTDGNYHVVTEAFLNDEKKWVMVDAQFNAVPTLNKRPLNLVELQYALAERLKGVEFGNLNQEMGVIYSTDLLNYLHFFYTPLDNRVVGATAPDNVKGGVMLVPLGERAPRSFAQAPIGKFRVTNALYDFYQKDQQ